MGRCQGARADQEQSAIGAVSDINSFTHLIPCQEEVNPLQTSKSRVVFRSCETCSARAMGIFHAVGNTCVKAVTQLPQIILGFLKLYLAQLYGASQ